MLTRKIKNFRTATQTSELNSIIDRTSKNILDYLSKKVPQVKDINKKYATSMDILDVMKQEFGAKGGISTAERIKVEKKISNIFSGEKGTGIEMLEKEIVGGKDIIGQEAGRLLSEGVSRSTASIGDLVRGLSQIVISPKMVGELTALTGITKTQAVKFIATLEKADPVTKGILLE
ncbi:MAG: hypothetical protein U9R08_00920 [Nanoarchaeota archaeon]|nr:hypothetical protein [Nanoarchaeota archaeon]